MVFPIPASATDVSRVGIVELREKARSILEIVASVTGEAVTLDVSCSALIRNRNADLVGVEEPVFRASKAFLVVPVPSGTSGVSRLGVVGGGKDAGTALEIIALIAGQAGTLGVSCSALIRNGNADLVGVEDPVFRASKADLIVPVPSGTSGVRGVSVVESREETSTILEVITLIAGQTVSIAVRSGALIRNGHTDFVGVKEPSL